MDYSQEISPIYKSNTYRNTKIMYCMIVDNLDRWCSLRRDEYLNCSISDKDKIGIKPTIKNFVNDILKNALNKTYNNLQNAHSSFMRMTFIDSDKCYSCNRYSNTVREIYIDNFLGRNRYGWICCEDCRKFVLIDKTFREIKMECLPMSSYNEFSHRNVKFWRESKNKAISPYLIENARIETDEANGLHYQNKYDTMCAVVSWPVENPLPGEYLNLMKAIPLANLIFYNRGIFGYTSNVMKDKILSKLNLLIISSGYLNG